MPRFKDDGRKALITRVAGEVHDAVIRAASALGVSASDFLAAAAIEKLDRTREDIVLAHSASEAEITRLSNLADSFTAEVTGKKRGRDV